jgi:hypothetical protein
MAAGTVTLYSKNKNLIKMSDLSSATIKLLLTTSTYVPDTSVTGNSVLADVTNELANANGYTTGGVALSAPTITSITGGYKFSSGNGIMDRLGRQHPRVAQWRDLRFRHAVGTDQPAARLLPRRCHARRHCGDRQRQLAHGQLPDSRVVRPHLRGP